MNSKSPSNLLIVCGTASDAMNAFKAEFEKSKPDIVRACRRTLVLTMKDGCRLTFVGKDFRQDRLEGITAKVCFHPSSDDLHKWDIVRRKVEARNEKG